MEKITKENAQAGFAELLDNEVVIYAVLKKLHITRSHPQYDDFISEARLLYIEAYQKNQHRNTNNFNFYFSKIYWGLLDRIRQNKYHQDHQCNPDDNDSEFEFTLDKLDLQELIEEKELIEEIREACNHNEWLIIKQYLAGKNVTEIARQLNVSRTTIYQYRKRLRNKLLRIFENKS